MGGYGSGRWGYGGSSRPHTDPLLFLDVRYLARNGYLAVPAGKTYVYSLAWTNRGEPSGSISVHVAGSPDGMPPEIVLDYRTQANGSETWKKVREPIDLDYTPCHYGGERPWFRCPGCFGRKAVLRSVGGRFRCNACHDLAYSSTRETEGDRMMRRAAVIRKKLGAPSSGYLWGWVPKPKGMRWATYDRLRAELRACQYGALADITARTDKLLADLDRKYGASG